MKTPALLVIAMIWLICGYLCAEEAPRYRVVDEGEKILFAGVTLKHLGMHCSVYFKAGKPDSITTSGPGNPEGMVVRREHVRIVTGEIFSIGKEHVQVMWFMEDNKLTSPGRNHIIQAGDIDYVLFEIPSLKWAEQGVKQR